MFLRMKVCLFILKGKFRSVVDANENETTGLDVGSTVRHVHGWLQAAERLASWDGFVRDWADREITFMFAT